jgi:hypothetical protein
MNVSPSAVAGHLKAPLPVGWDLLHDRIEANHIAVLKECHSSLEYCDTVSLATMFLIDPVYSYKAKLLRVT